MLCATLTCRRPMVFRSLFTWTIFLLFTSFLQHGQVFCLERGISVMLEAEEGRWKSHACPSKPSWGNPAGPSFLAGGAMKGSLQ